MQLQNQEQKVNAASTLWARNDIQFPRLLAKIMATQDVDMGALAISMNLNHDEVAALFDRAQVTWGAIVDQLVCIDGASGKTFFPLSRELEINISFAVGALDREQLEETATEAGVTYDELMSDDDLRAHVLEAARRRRGLKVFDADNGVTTFGFQTEGVQPVHDPRGPVPIPAPRAPAENLAGADSQPEIPVLFEIDPVSREATGTVMPFCSTTCREACTTHGLREVKAGMSSLASFGYQPHCEQCGKPARGQK